MATPDDIIEAKRIANARAQAQAAAQSVDPFALAAQLAAAPKATGVSQAELDAIAASKLAATAAQSAAKTQATAAAAAVPGATIDPKTGLIIPPAKVSTGKKIVGYIQWKHPVSGVIYNVPKYDDGTDATSEWTGGAQVPASFTIVTQDKSGTGSGSTGAGTPQVTYTATDGKKFTDQQAYVAYQQQLDSQKAQRQSAYDLLYQQFNEYGLGSLVTPLKGLIESGISPSEFTLRLRESEAYKKRFAANQGRIAKGLRALSEAEYINLEDQYQNVMRNYGLPASYYAKGDMGVQPGFEKFISGDVSPAELEDRIQTAQNRVINAAPEVTRALKQFYPDITNGDILAYALDPEQALTTLKRKVQAAEIGGAALQAGLETGLTRAEELQKYGVTQAQAQQGYQAIAGYLPRASTLSDIYSKQGVGPYTQTTAEQEVFGLPSAAEAATKRKRLSELEQAAFSGQAGRAQGALARERAGQF